MNEIIFWSFWITIGLIALWAVHDYFYSGPGVDNPMPYLLGLPVLFSMGICVVAFCVQLIRKVML